MIIVARVVHVLIAINNLLIGHCMLADGVCICHWLVFCVCVCVYMCVGVCVCACGCVGWMLWSMGFQSSVMCV